MLNLPAQGTTTAVPDTTQFLCLQPLPISTPGLNARLGGIALQRCDYSLNAIDKAQFLQVRLPPHQLPNPVYLLKQNLSPSLFEDGISEYELLQQIIALCEPAHVLPVIFNYKYFAYLEALALRCFKGADFLDGIEVLDLKVVLQAACLFGSLSAFAPQALSSLNAVAAALKITISEPLTERAASLPGIIAYLRQYDAPILQFCLRGRNERVRRLQQSLQQGSLVVMADGVHICAAVCTGLNGHTAQLLCTDRELNVYRYTLRLSQPVLIAPQGILTEQRQQHLSFNLSQAARVLQQALTSNSSIEDDRSPPSLAQSFFEHLSAAEKTLYQETGKRNPQLLPRPPLGASPFFKELLFLYQADNFRDCLVDSELEAYRTFCARRLQRNATRYAAELKSASSLLNENDEKQQRLFLKLSTYLQKL